VHIHETGTEAIKRLESDLRTFSRAGIERIAWGWRQHDTDSTRLHEAEQEALPWLLPEKSPRPRRVRAQHLDDLTVETRTRRRLP